MTCDKEVINGPNLKKLAQKNQIVKVVATEKKNPSENPEIQFCKGSHKTKYILDILPAVYEK